MMQEGSALVGAPGGREVHELLRIRGEMVALLELVDETLAESRRVTEQPL